jgi:hypothetical protein
LWPAVRRSKLLPEGGAAPPDQLRLLTMRLQSAYKFAKKIGRVELSDLAKKLWVREYPMLTADVPGTLGSVTSRAEAQVRRLALIYALMDESGIVKVHHLRGALGLWTYCFDSAQFIFAGRSPRTREEKVLAALQTAPNGLTQTEISAAFHNHLQGIDALLHQLQQKGLVESKLFKTAGRSVTRWFAVQE